MHRKCMIEIGSHLATFETFFPDKILENDPHAQLWNEDCRCKSWNTPDPSDQEYSLEKGGQEVNVTAVRFCSKLFEDVLEEEKEKHGTRYAFENSFFRKKQWRKKLKEKGIDQSVCQKTLEDSMKEGLLHISNASGSSIEELFHEFFGPKRKNQRKKRFTIYQDTQRNAFWLVSSNKKPPKSMAPLGVLVGVSEKTQENWKNPISLPQFPTTKKRPSPFWV